MRLYVRGEVIDASKEPVVVQFSSQDKWLISRMVESDTCYGEFPASSTLAEREAHTAEAKSALESSAEQEPDIAAALRARIDRSTTSCA